MESLLRKVVALCVVVLPTFLLAVTASAATHQYGGFSYQIEAQLPDWVDPQKKQSSRGKPEGQNIEYLMLDKQIHAFPDNFQTHIARSMVLHNSQAVSDGSQLEIIFNPAYETLTLHQLMVTRDDEAIDKLSTNHIRLLQQEEDLANGILNGEVTAAIIIPNVRPGDRIDYSYTLTGRNPIFGNKIFGIHQMGWQIDVGVNRLRLLVPKNTQLTTQARSLNTKPKIKKRRDFKEYTWQLKEVPGRADEGDYPGWYSPYPYIEFTEFKSWQEIEQWAQTLFESVDQKSEELELLVKEFGKNNSSHTDYALQSLQFAQEQVRYVGLELGVNSHLPHSPNEVLENRFGDCKDKSNLLMQMLERGGVEAYPALVSYDYQEGFDRFLPSPYVFDHVIVMANVDGKKVWMDPTRSYQTGQLQNRAHLPFGKALVIGQDKENPIQAVDASTGQINQIKITEHFIVDGVNKPVTFNVESRYYGAQAEDMRYNFGYYTVKEMQQHYLNYYAKIYPSLSLKETLTYQDDKESNVFVLRESYEVSELFDSENNFHEGGFYMGTIYQWLSSPKIVQRETPLTLGGPFEITQKLIIDFPGEVGLTVDSTPIEKISDGVKYLTRVVYFDGRFEQKSQLNVSKAWIEADQVPQFMKLKEFVNNDTDFNLTFTYPYSKEVSENVNKLVEAIGAQ